MYANRPHSDEFVTRPGLQVVDDELLVERARTEPDAFEAIYQRYSVSVYRMCFRATGDPDIADDLTSIVFLKAFERLDQYRRRVKGTFRAWLFTIVRNATLDHWRRNRRLTSSSDEQVDWPDPDPGPEDIALAQLQIEDVRNVLSSLNEHQRSIIEFRLSGLTTREISDALEMSISAVKSAQTRAYTRIRSLLVDTGE